VVVFSSLFPSSVRPWAGLFIRERMFRVARHLPLTVISPQPWSPLDGLIRRRRPHFRPSAPRQETQQGIEVHFPRFLSLPGLVKWLDGPMMALAALGLLRRLKAAGRVDVLDSHFAYPDGYAATRLGRWLGLPVSITLRGTEPRTAGYPWRGRQQRAALRRADRVFAVSHSLRRLALEAGVPEERTRRVGNGVDIERFRPLDRDRARAALGLDPVAPVLVSVGGLVERKGFHRVIELLPALRERYPGLVFLVVGGPSPEGDFSAELRRQVAALGLEDAVRFLGPWPPERLREVLSAAEVFVLATANEGWANVFLEAMACGLPVVTTEVGGNREVVCDPRLGTVVPSGDADALRVALIESLAKEWDRAAIRRYAEDNSWDGRVAVLLEEFRTLAGRPRR
jgi:glycosyltransferase involved in cell wall biosynthesis